MFLTVHASAGLLIGSQIANPWLAFVLGFISHLILDIIPHGDNNIGEHWPRWVKIKRLFLIEIADTFGIILLVYYLVSHNFILLTPSVIAAVIGTALPDYIWGFYELTQWRILGYVSSRILMYFHDLLNCQVPILTGIFIQLTTLIIFLLLIIYK